MPWWQAYKGSWQCSTDSGKEMLLPWQCALLERHGCRAQQQPWGDQYSVSGMKATSDFTRKKMSTTELSLLFCMPEKTGQCIAVMAGALVSSSRDVSESWLVQKDMMRSPQLRSRSIAKSSSSLQKIWDTRQLTASSKPPLMAHSDRVKSWKTLKKCYQPLLKADC